MIVGVVPSVSFGLKSGNHFVTGSSSESCLRSTSASAVTMTMGFDTEDSRNNASGCMGLRVSWSTRPAARW